MTLVFSFRGTIGLKCSQWCFQEFQWGLIKPRS